MAEHHHHQLQQEWAPSGSQVLSVAVLLPVGGTLLALSAVTLTLTVIGLALAVPVFMIFSPVLAPAAILIGLSVMGFLASGAFGLTCLTSLSWIFGYLRGAKEEVEQWKRRIGDTAAEVVHREKELGGRIQS